jgi:LuxR family transcriptional regulator, maltose regulon positive regulatory protein
VAEDAPLQQFSDMNDSPGSEQQTLPAGQLSIERINSLLSVRLLLLQSSNTASTAILLAQTAHWVEAETGRQPVRLVLGEADNQPGVFARNLLDAVKASLPGLFEEGGESDDPYECLENLLNSLAESAEVVVTFIENYGVVREEEVHALTAYLLGYLPEQVHILIQTEKPPPLPLGRLRVRRQLVELMEE